MGVGRYLFLIAFLLPPPVLSGCPADLSHHDKEHNACLIKQGYSCSVIPGNGCVPNAFCNHKQVCKCRIGFYPNFQDLCVHGFSETCMTSLDCDSDKGLKCDLSGKCSCPFPDQFYDEDAKRCLTHFGRNCSNGGQCDSNFLCKNDTCVCPEGLDLTKPKDKCSAGLGKVCGKQEDCDGSRLLLCVHGTCKCQHPLQEYSGARGMCVGLEGAHCNMSKGPEDYNDNLFCVEGTNCQPIIGSLEIGMCKSGGSSTMLQQFLFALMIFSTVGLMISFVAFYWENQSKKSHRAPVKNADDLETGTTTTLISCADEPTLASCNGSGKFSATGENINSS